MEASTTSAVIILVLGAFSSFGMLFSLGGNDTANSIGVAVGSGALSVPLAILLASSMNLIGALLAGSHVTTNVTSHVAPFLAHTSADMLTAIAYLAGLAAAMIVVGAGTRAGLPLASTHAMIGGLVGAAIGLHGLTAVNWTFLQEVAVAWVTSPLLGGAICLFLRISINLASPSHAAAITILPALASLNAVACLAVLAFIAPPIVKDFLRPFEYALALEFALLFLVVYIITLRHLRRRFAAGLDNKLAPTETLAVSSSSSNAPGDEELGANHPDFSGKYGSIPPSRMEKLVGFRHDENSPVYQALLIAAVPAIAFAHGSNDVSNGIGPFLGILAFAVTALTDTPLSNPPPTAILFPVLVAGGMAIALGIALFGRDVMNTVGHGGISRAPWTYATAFAAQAAAAAAVTMASAFGIPVSTCHTVVGAVMASAISLPKWADPSRDDEAAQHLQEQREHGEGNAGFNWPMVKMIGAGVVLTPVVAASIAAVGTGIVSAAITA